MKKEEKSFIVNTGGAVFFSIGVLYGVIHEVAWITMLSFIGFITSGWLAMDDYEVAGDDR